MPRLAKKSFDMWEELADFAKAHPGEWCSPDIFVHSPSAVAHNIRSGEMKSFRPVDHWEARCKNNNVEVRYLITRNKT